MQPVFALQLLEVVEHLADVAHLARDPDAGHIVERVRPYQVFRLHRGEHPGVLLDEEIVVAEKHIPELEFFDAAGGGHLSVLRRLGDHLNQESLERELASQRVSWHVGLEKKRRQQL